MRLSRPPVTMSVLLAITLAASGAASAQDRPPAPGADRSRGEEEQIRKREEWFVLSRGLDKVARPDLLRARAVAEMAGTGRARADLLRLRGETWQPLGPETMTMFTWVMGPVAGRVVSLAVHPSDENILYLGAASGGLWKTVDGGLSWAPVFDSAGTLSIGALALDPADPNVLWVGTGERQSGCASYFGLGLFRSDDGGQTFEPRNGAAPNALELSYIVSVVPHPTDPQTLLVSGDAFCQDGVRLPGGVFKTTDGGTTWRKVVAGTGSDVIYDPGNPNVVYAMISGTGVFKSLDGGDTWTLSSTGITPSSRMRLAMAPSSAQTLYVLTSGDLLYRSDDGGATWALKNSSACEGQCTYNLCLDVHPTDPQTILVGTIRFAKSTDGGRILAPLDNTWGSTQKVHQDIHIVRFSRLDGQRFWVGGDGGLWRTDTGGPFGYANLNANLILTQFYDVAMDPTDPFVVFGGAQDNSSSRRFGNLQQWNVTYVTGDGFVNVIDPATPSLVFQTSYPSGSLPSVYRSTSGGTPGTFVRLATTGIDAGPFPWVTPLAVRPDAIFVASNSVYRGRTSQTGSFTWERISGSLSNGSVSVLTRSNIGPDPWPYGGDIWAGTSDGRIHRGRNDMEYGPRVQWTNVSGDYPGAYVSDIAADVGQPDRVFVTRGAFGLSRLYRSTTGGTTWTAVGTGLPNVPANAVAVDPLDADRVFVGTDVGVYESTDGGDTFLPFSEGMPLGVVVTDLEIAAAPHVLVAGTYGRGAFLVNLLATPAPAGAKAQTAR